MEQRHTDIARLLSSSLAPRTLDLVRSDHRTIIHRIESLRQAFATERRSVSYTEYGTLDATEDRTSPAGGGVRRTVTTDYLANTSGMLPDRLIMLLSLVRALEPRIVVELGTCVGMSAAYVLAGLHANGSGRLVTLEGGVEIAALAEDNLERLGFERFTVVSGRHQERLVQVLSELLPVDLAVIDGDHSEETTLWAFRVLARFVADAAVLFLDDIRWSAGMTSAWEQLLASTSGVAAAADLGEIGVLLVARDHVGPPEMLPVG